MVGMNHKLEHISSKRQDDLAYLQLRNAVVLQ